MHGVFVVVISEKEKTTMKLAIGIDVHKDKCTACAAYAGIGEPRERHLDFIEKFNKSFERFPFRWKRDDDPPQLSEWA